MVEFYCGHCGKIKNISARCTRKGKKPICASCLDRANKISAKSDAARDSRRRYALRCNAFDVSKILNKEK